MAASSTKKIIVVIGATGNQGSSVAHTFLGLSTWHVRCVTRNTGSPAAQALTALGAEVIQADLSDQSSLVPAFKDANAIFLNTDFWATYAAANRASQSQDAGENSSSEAGFDQEVSHGKNAAITAAGIPSLERLVYSALGPMKKHSKGKYPNSYHWESKATIVEYIENEQSELAKKTSFIYPGAFTTNPLLTPKLDPVSGKYTFVLPTTTEMRMPIIDPRESTGPFVRALVEDEEAGTKLLAYDSYLKMEEIVDLWSRLTQQDIGFVEMSGHDMHQKFGIPIEVLDAPSFVEEFGYTGGVDGVIQPHQLKTEVPTKSFENWLKERDWKAMLESAEAGIKELVG